MGNAFTLQVKGTINEYHLNENAAPDRTSCIKMNIATGVSDWMCLWKSNNLHKGINAMLLTAYAASKTCYVMYATPGPDGHHSIIGGSCY